MNKKLGAMYLKLLLDERVIALRRFGHVARRALTFGKREVTVFLQLDDPYSYLLAHYLPALIENYPKVEFRLYLGQSLRGDYMPEPAMQAEYALQDCRMLARELGVPFLDVGSTPAVEKRRPLLDFLAQEQGEDDFAESFIKALTLYWRGDSDGITRFLGKISLDETEASILVGKNQLLLRKMGHYNCATLYYEGAWYWGIDRLLYLVDRLESQGQNRFGEPIEELKSLRQAMQLNLPATAPARAAGLPPLEMFHSFRSPYSYLALPRAFAIADAFGLKLKIRPVLPMVMRGVKLPKSKLLYILQDANREAARQDVPFGRIADPLGPGAERAMAAFCYARGEGKEREFLLEAGKAIMSEAVDVASDEGLLLVAERAGLFWPDMKKALSDDGWRKEAEANRQALTDAGLWGVPSFRIGNIAMWGQDRAWLLARQIEDLCHGGEGIIE